MDGVALSTQLQPLHYTSNALKKRLTIHICYLVDKAAEAEEGLWYVPSVRTIYGLLLDKAAFCSN
jgi:hypothetical protein